MTAPLFDIKSRFSEYVTMAENGEVVEITKHGKISAVIIGINEFNRLQENYRPSFVEKLNEWRRNTDGLSQGEYQDFENALKRNKEVYSTKSLSAS